MEESDFVDDIKIEEETDLDVSSSSSKKNCTVADYNYHLNDSIEEKEEGTAKYEEITADKVSQENHITFQEENEGTTKDITIENDNVARNGKSELSGFIKIGILNFASVRIYSHNQKKYSAANTDPFSDTVIMYGQYKHIINKKKLFTWNRPDVVVYTCVNRHFLNCPGTVFMEKDRIVESMGHFCTDPSNKKIPPRSNFKYINKVLLYHNNVESETEALFRGFTYRRQAKKDYYTTYKCTRSDVGCSAILQIFFKTKLLTQIGQHCHEVDETEDAVRDSEAKDSGEVPIFVYTGALNLFFIYKGHLYHKNVLDTSLRCIDAKKNGCTGLLHMIYGRVTGISEHTCLSKEDFNDLHIFKDIRTEFKYARYLGYIYKVCFEDQNFISWTCLGNGTRQCPGFLTTRDNKVEKGFDHQCRKTDKSVKKKKCVEPIEIKSESDDEVEDNNKKMDAIFREKRVTFVFQNSPQPFLLYGMFLYSPVNLQIEENKTWVCNKWVCFNAETKACTGEVNMKNGTVLSETTHDCIKCSNDGLDDNIIFFYTDFWKRGNVYALNCGYIYRRSHVPSTTCRTYWWECIDLDKQNFKCSGSLITENTRIVKRTSHVCKNENSRNAVGNSHEIGIKQIADNMNVGIKDVTTTYNAKQIATLLTKMGLVIIFQENPLPFLLLNGFVYRYFRIRERKTSIWTRWMCYNNETKKCKGEVNIVITNENVLPITKHVCFKHFNKDEDNSIIFFYNDKRAKVYAMHQGFVYRRATPPHKCETICRWDCQGNKCDVKCQAVLTTKNGGVVDYTTNHICRSESDDDMDDKVKLTGMLSSKSTSGKQEIRNSDTRTRQSRGSECLDILSNHYQYADNHNRNMSGEINDYQNIKHHTKTDEYIDIEYPKIDQCNSQNENEDIECRSDHLKREKWKAQNNDSEYLNNYHEIEQNDDQSIVVKEEGQDQDGSTEYQKIEQYQNQRLIMIADNVSSYQNTGQYGDQKWHSDSQGCQVLKHKDNKVILVFNDFEAFLIHDGYLYRSKNRVIEPNTRWMCFNDREGCPGELYLEDEEVMVVAKHICLNNVNHDEDLVMFYDEKKENMYAMYKCYIYKRSNEKDDIKRWLCLGSSEMTCKAYFTIEDDGVMIEPIHTCRITDKIAMEENINLIAERTDPMSTEIANQLYGKLKSLTDTVVNKVVNQIVAQSNETVCKKIKKTNNKIVDTSTCNPKKRQVKIGRIVNDKSFRKDIRELKKVYVLDFVLPEQQRNLNYNSTLQPNNGFDYYPKRVKFQGQIFLRNTTCTLPSDTFIYECVNQYSSSCPSFVKLQNRQVAEYMQHTCKDFTPTSSKANSYDTAIQYFRNKETGDDEIIYKRMRYEKVPNLAGLWTCIYLNCLSLIQIQHNQVIKHTDHTCDDFVDHLDPTVHDANPYIETVLLYSNRLTGRIEALYKGVVYKNKDWRQYMTVWGCANLDKECDGVLKLFPETGLCREFGTHTCIRVEQEAADRSYQSGAKRQRMENFQSKSACNLKSITDETNETLSSEIITIEDETDSESGSLKNESLDDLEVSITQNPVLLKDEETDL